MLRRLTRRLRVLLVVLRVMPVTQVGLRAGLVATGGAALVLAQGPWGMPGGLVVAVGVAALVGAVVAPENAGPGVVMGAAALAWLLRWGLHRPVPLAGTAVLAALLYLFHTTAALLAALPPVARVEPAVLVRWYGHAAGVLVLAEAVGLAASLAGRVTGGILVDLVGLVGVVVLAGVPVLLARRAGGRPERRRAGGS